MPETNWTAERISADAANKMQVTAGLLLNAFTLTAPTEPPDEAIVCETTGGFHATCKPVPSDIFEDVDNAEKGTMEGARIDKWECEFSTTALSITEETLALALGASESTSSPATGVTPRRQFTASDFKKLYWIGDMVDPKKLFVIEMENAVSTGGFDFQSTDDKKGTLALTIKPHGSLKAQGKVPMSFYILTKQGGPL